MKVSVAMITHNHERFIAQAIKNVLMQETDFGVELVIGEDSSADGTRDIVVAYQRQYPDKIRLLLSEQNLGGTRTRGGRSELARASTLLSSKAMNIGPRPTSCRSRWISWIATRGVPFAFTM
jgi:glycosyltransferase involved in cell wall biosynthesis